MGKIIDPPPWRPEALIYIFAGAIGMPILSIFARDDLSTKTLILAATAVPIGAICGLFAWGYAENLGRRK